MKEYDNWQAGGIGGGRDGDGDGDGGEEAEPEVARGVNDDIIGFDAVKGFNGWRNFEIEEVH